MSLRAMTWNVWWRFGNWEERQPGILQTIAEERPDIVFLQEAWAEVGGLDQAHQIAERLGGFHVGPVEPNLRETFGFSNVVVSRWPFRHTLRERLPDATGGASHRTVAGGIIEHPDGGIATLSSHIAHRRVDEEDRIAQTAALRDMTKRFLDEGFPVILGGDLNAAPDAPSIKILREESPLQDVWDDADGPGLTWTDKNEHCAESLWLNRRIDYLLAASPRGPISATSWLAGTTPINGTLPSDHYAVVADITFP